MITFEIPHKTYTSVLRVLYSFKSRNCLVSQVLHKPATIQDFLWYLLTDFLLEFLIQHNGSWEVSMTGYRYHQTPDLKVV